MKPASAIILALSLALALALFPVEPPLTPQKPAYATQSVRQGGIAPEVIAECWEAAKALADAPESWEVPDTIILDPVFRPEGHGRLLGHHFTIMEVDEDGDITAHDRIYIYLNETEARNYPELVKEVLTHELLHAIYLRKANTDWKWASDNDDNEAWVRHLMGEENGIREW